MPTNDRVQIIAACFAYHLSDGQRLHETLFVSPGGHALAQEKDSSKKNDDGSYTWGTHDWIAGVTANPREKLKLYVNAQLVTCKRDYQDARTAGEDPFAYLQA